MRLPFGDSSAISSEAASPEQGCLGPQISPFRISLSQISKFSAMTQWLLSIIPKTGPNPPGYLLYEAIR